MKAALLFLICSIESNGILAICVSILALVTAIVTLIFTIKTFKSQKNTEENTAYIFTHEKQFEAFENMANSLINGFYNALAIKNSLQKCNGNVISSALLFPIAYIDPNEIHLELFFKNRSDTSSDDNATNYTVLRELMDAIVSYNVMCDVISHQVQNHVASRNDLEKLYDTIIGKTFDLLGFLVDATKSIFDKGNDRLKYKEELQYYMIIRIFVRMKVEYNLEGRAFHFGFDQQLEDLMKINANEIKVVDQLVEDTKEMWEQILGDYNYSKTRLFGKHFSLEVIMKFLKLNMISINSSFEANYPKIPY